MALREFTDSAGRSWTAWDVPPHRIYTQPRVRTERRVAPAAAWTPERRTGRDRRRRVTHPHLLGGWVCFTSAREKRRLSPPPAGWDACSDAELEALCARAQAETRAAAAAPGQG